MHEVNVKRRGGNRLEDSKNNGSITLLVLVFSGIMVMLLGGVSGFLFAQNRLQTKKADKELAMQIAEAGVDYYRWFLSHYPDDLTDKTGVSPGPYEHEYLDPQGSAIGKFSLQINGNSQCGTLRSVDISSTGWTYDDPAIKRKVSVRYSRPSVAEYAYIIDDNVWAGSDRQIKGKYHSNGGIRMDGENDSLVTSAKETWNCTSSFGCDPTEEKPGVFGAGSGFDLWSFPVEPIDFTGITVDLAEMKQAAKDYGIYIPPSGSRGYHAIFKSDGTVDIYKVTRVNDIRSYSSEDGWHWSPEYISRESFYNNYPVPSDCSLIFIEDDLWVGGTVEGKVSIASADLINPSGTTDVWLQGNITYNHSDGSDGLLVVGENSVRIPLYSPDNMELKGIFVAQKGHFGRNYYTESGRYRVPSYLRSYVKRNLLKITGSIISKGRVGTKWTSGGVFVSGYENRENSYDRELMSDPPPMTPFADDEYTFIKWEEVN